LRGNICGEVGKKRVEIAGNCSKLFIFAISNYYFEYMKEDIETFYFIYTDV